MPESFHVLPVSAHWSAKISAHMIGIGGWLTVFIMAAVCHLGFLVVKRPILHRVAPATSHLSEGSVVRGSTCPRVQLSEGPLVHRTKFHKDRENRCGDIAL